MLRHADNIRNVFGLPCVCAVNAFPTDTESERALLHARLEENGIEYADTRVWAMGGEGGRELAEKVVRICSGSNDFRFSYDLSLSPEEKIRSIVRRIYRGRDIVFSDTAAKQLREIKRLGFDGLPVCMSKTPYSFTDDPSRPGAPEDFTVTVREVLIRSGAGFLVALTGTVLTMPGLPKRPAAEKIDIDADGNITGLF